MFVFYSIFEEQAPCPEKVKGVTSYSGGGRYEKTKEGKVIVIKSAVRIREKYFFDDEIKNLKNLKVIITLGKIAFDNCIKFYKKNYTINKKLIFIHGTKYKLPDGKILIPCYHPSPRNVNTKVINRKKMINLLKAAKKIL